MRLTAIGRVLLCAVVAAAPARRSDAQPGDAAFASLLRGDLADWVFEHGGQDRVTPGAGTLLVSDRAGVVRSKRLRWGDFSLRFDVRAAAPATHAAILMFARVDDRSGVTAALGVPLLGEAVDRKALKIPRLATVAMNAA